jgi:hypothetical protein
MRSQSGIIFRVKNFVFQRLVIIHYHCLMMRFKDRLALALFMFFRLPAAWWSGVRVISLDEKVCQVTIREKWFNRNPFRSVYFACLAMAAEMASGFPAFYYLRQKQYRVSMLVIRIEAEFSKKAKGKISFSCQQIEDIHKTIESTVATGQPAQMDCISIGSDATGEEVAKFTVRWSYKGK